MRDAKGMGLIEVIIGLGLIAVCIIGMNALVMSLIRGNLSARLTDQASRLAQTKIQELRSAGYDKATVGSSSDVWWSAASGGSIAFQRTTTIAAGMVPNTRVVTVTMAWTDRGARREVFTTELAP
jgi:Tfp pilus assembly protein PilV